MDDIERKARAIFRAKVDPMLWKLTWENAPPHYRDACLTQARDLINEIDGPRTAPPIAPAP